MAIRVVQDSKHRIWRVWLVAPLSALPRVIERRKAPREIERRSWLVCDCEALRVRRRVFDFPENWDSMPDAQLLQICESAVRSTKTRRLIE